MAEVNAVAFEAADPECLPNNEERRQSALAFSRAGLSISPLKPGTKVPYTTADDVAVCLKGGPRIATRDPAKINAMFDAKADINFSIAMGEISPGVFVNAFDLDKAKDPAGLDAFRNRFCAGLGCALHDLTSQSTPNGGEHFFALTKGYRLRNDVNAAGIMGLDIRGAQGQTDGYVVGPKSVVMRKDGSKGTYTFHPGRARSALNIVELPRDFAVELGLRIDGEPKPLSKNRTTAPIASPTSQPIRSANVQHLVSSGIGWARAQLDALRLDQEFAQAVKDRAFWIEAVVLPLANAVQELPEHAHELFEIALAASALGGAAYDPEAEVHIRNEFERVLGGEK